MSDRQVKLYKNPYRKNDNYEEKDSTPYVPNYKSMGISPELIESEKSNQPIKVALPDEDEPNPRLRKMSIRQESNEPNRQNIIGGLVNIGNNMEHTWSGVDGEIFDDISSVSFDDNSKMIDNNDFVDLPDNAPKFMGHNMTAISEGTAKRKFLTEEDLKEALTKELQEKLSPLHFLDEDSYILMIDGVVIEIGNVSKIEEQANLLIFGDHEICEGNPIPAEHILILKRVKVKIGLFLE